MMQETIFAAAEAAELTRVVQCCPGVENKLCAGDQWKGNLGPFVAEIERLTIERCIEFIRGGSFLHDQAPPKLFATEVTAEMEKQLLPTNLLRVTTEMLHSAAKAVLGDAKPAALQWHTTDVPGDHTYEAKIETLHTKHSKVGEDGVLKND